LVNPFFALELSFGAVLMHQLRQLLVELVLISLSTISALVLRDNFELSEARLFDFAPYLLCTLATAAVVFPAMQTNRSLWRFTTAADYMRIFGATVATVAGAVAAKFVVNRMEGLPRALPVLQVLLILFSLVSARFTICLWTVARGRPVRPEAEREERGCKNVLVAGVSELANIYLRSAAQFAPDRIRIAGVLGPDDRYVGRSIQGYPILGMPEQIADVLRNLEIHGVFIDRVVITTAFETLPPQAQSALIGLEKTTDVSLEFFVDQIGRTLCSSSAGPTNSRAAFSLRPENVTALTRPSWWPKRALDLIGALVLLIVLAPLMTVVAILVAIDVGLPLTFWQQRPGLHGRPFEIYKFRTMAAGHDARGRRVPDDQRISTIGRFLRRARLDELPQLLNILSGEMSFVGPRPLLTVEQPAAPARLLVRPGLTGWAQVKGGRQITPADRAALDIWYVHNASMLLDLEILARTVPVVLFGESVDAAAIRCAWCELEKALLFTSRKSADGQVPFGGIPECEREDASRSAADGLTALA
jgi:lipopolysaccharide/colanic/teichoic acid biosynthesis glycosyltransferase